MKVAVFAIVVWFILIVGAFLAFAQEVPNDAKLLGMNPLPCSGYIAYFDTDGDEANGAEFIAVYADGEPTPRAVVEFDSGHGGGFKLARVGARIIKTYEELAEAYPHPCEIVMEPQGIKT